MSEFDVRIRIHGETFERTLNNKLSFIERVLHSDEVKRRVAEIYLDCIEPLVPKENGDLRKSAQVGETKYKGDYPVIYTAPYAKPQYEGSNGRCKDGTHKIPGSMWNRHTSNTYDHWNKHLSRADRQAMYELMQEDIMEKMEKLRHG